MDGDLDVSEPTDESRVLGGGGGLFLIQARSVAQVLGVTGEDLGGRVDAAVAGGRPALDERPGLDDLRLRGDGEALSAAGVLRLDILGVLDFEHPLLQRIVVFRLLDALIRVLDLAKPGTRVSRLVAATGVAHDTAVAAVRVADVDTYVLAGADVGGSPARVLVITFVVAAEAKQKDDHDENEGDASADQNPYPVREFRGRIRHRRSRHVGDAYHTDGRWSRPVDRIEVLQEADANNPDG